MGVLIPGLENILKNILKVQFTLKTAITIYLVHCDGQYFSLQNSTVSNTGVFWLWRAWQPSSNVATLCKWLYWATWTPLGHLWVNMALWERQSEQRVIFDSFDPLIPHHQSTAKGIRTDYAKSGEPLVSNQNEFLECSQKLENLPSESRQMAWCEARDIFRRASAVLLKLCNYKQWGRAGWVNMTILSRHY